MTAPHDHPTSAELVEAVREFLERDVMTATEGRVQFHTRVAINVLNMVERELKMGPDQSRNHEDGLAALGFDSETVNVRAVVPALPSALDAGATPTVGSGSLSMIVPATE